jgi:hypothetical protein
MKQRNKIGAAGPLPLDNSEASRCTVIKTLAMLRLSEQRREQNEQRLLTLMRQAKQSGDESLYGSIKEQLRWCLANKKMLREMTAELEIVLQMEEMRRMTEMFRACMESRNDAETLLSDLQSLSEQCGEQKKNGTQALQRYFELCGAPVSDDEACVNDVTQLISDQELHKLLDWAADEPCSNEANADIDDKLACLRKKMEGV